MYYTVYSTLLYSTLLYSTLLHCTALHCTALHCTVLYTVLYTVQYCAVLYCILYCAVLYTVLCCTVLYCTFPDGFVEGYRRPITANLPTNIADFRGFDSSIILIYRGGIVMSIGNWPESLSQAMLVGIILVGSLGVALAISWLALWSLCGLSLSMLYYILV